MNTRPLLQVILLRPRQVDDRLLLYEIARTVNRIPPGQRRLVFIHGRGEMAHRHLEQAGLDRDDPVPLSEPEREERRIILDRAIRESNRRLVSVFTDSGIPTVGWQGYDRGLIATRNGGKIEAIPGKVWIELVERGVVMILSTLAKSSKKVDFVGDEIPAEQVTQSLCHALATRFEIQCTVFLSERFEDFRSRGKPVENISIREMEEKGIVSFYEDIKYIVEGGFPVLLTTVDSYDTGKKGSLRCLVT